MPPGQIVTSLNNLSHQKKSIATVWTLNTFFCCENASLARRKNHSVFSTSSRFGSNLDWLQNEANSNLSHPPTQLSRAIFHPAAGEGIWLVVSSSLEVGTKVISFAGGFMSKVLHLLPGISLISRVDYFKQKDEPAIWLFWITSNFPPLLKQLFVLFYNFASI